MTFKVLALSLACGLLAACASGTTTVLVPPTEAAKTSVQAIKVVQGDHTVSPDEDQRALFEAKLREGLYAEGGFREGDDLTLRYRYIQYKRGSQAARYFVGLGTGKGVQTIEVVFLTPAGEEVSKIQVGGEISAGIAGGTIGQATAKAAEETVTYALQSFK